MRHAVQCLLLHAHTSIHSTKTYSKPSASPVTIVPGLPHGSNTIPASPPLPACMLATGARLARRSKSFRVPSLQLVSSSRGSLCAQDSRSTATGQPLLLGLERTGTCSVTDVTQFKLEACRGDGTQCSLSTCRWELCVDSVCSLTRGCLEHCKHTNQCDYSRA
jgi:hypothetical protein